MIIEIDCSVTFDWKEHGSSSFEHSNILFKPREFMLSNAKSRALKPFSIKFCRPFTFDHHITFYHL